MTYRLNVNFGKIILVGAGGTGSFVAEGLCRLLINYPDIPIYIIDFDTVEKKNILRQNFYPQDVGKFKAQALAERYAQSKMRQAELLAEEIIQLADECMPGEKTKIKSNGEVETTTGDMVERSKLRVDARKWVAAQLLPKKYGERVAVDHDVAGNLADMMRQHLAGKK